MDDHSVPLFDELRSTRNFASTGRFENHLSDGLPIPEEKVIERRERYDDCNICDKALSEVVPEKYDVDGDHDDHYRQHEKNPARSSPHKSDLLDLTVPIRRAKCTNQKLEMGISPYFMICEGDART